MQNTVNTAGRRRKFLAEILLIQQDFIGAILLITQPQGLSHPLMQRIKIVAAGLFRQLVILLAKEAQHPLVKMVI